MKKIKFILYFIVLSVILSIFQFSISKNSQDVFAYTCSQAECVMEVLSGRVLFSKNSAKKLPLASTTKILTAITVIENFDINKQICVPKECVGVEGSSIYLRKGEHLTVKELLYGLMLRSGNDCAECLAITLTESRDDFIDLMNQTAKKIGANSSSFTNPHGLHDENHYTTASDLCKISVYALKNPIFKEIVKTKKIEISNEGYDYKRLLINKNKMLSRYDGATGVKTGFTKKAGRCLVSSAKVNGMEVVCVVLNSPQMWERSEELLDFAYDNYTLYEVFNSKNYTDKVYTESNNKKFLLSFEKDVNNDGNFINNYCYPLTENEFNGLKYTVNGVLFDEFIKKPQNNGVFEIFLQNKLIFSQNIFKI